MRLVTATIVAHLSLTPDFGTNQLLPETAAAKTAAQQTNIPFKNCGAAECYLSFVQFRT
jgi:hypothetical protein